MGKVWMNMSVMWMVECDVDGVVCLPLSRGLGEFFVLESWLSFAEVLKGFFSHKCGWPPFRMFITG